MYCSNDNIESTAVDDIASTTTEQKTGDNDLNQEPGSVLKVFHFKKRNFSISKIGPF